MSDLDIRTNRPAPLEPPPRTARPAARPSAAAAPSRILLACDPFLSETLERVLDHHAAAICPAGLAVRRVGDGIACLREMEMQRPSLLIIAGLLDKLTGKEVVETWRKAHPGDSVPVLFLSTLFGADVPSGLAVVPVSVPFRNEDLVEAVSKALAASAA